MKQLIILTVIIMLFGSMKKPDVFPCSGKQIIQSKWYYKGKLVKTLKHPVLGFHAKFGIVQSFDYEGKEFQSDSVSIKKINQ